MKPSVSEPAQTPYPSNAGERLYLAYGSNLHPVRLRERVASARLLGTVVLEGWRLHFHKRSFVDGSGKCNIERIDDLDSRVHAAVFAIAARDEAALDRVEGLGRGYDKAELDLAAFGIGRAFTFVAAPQAVDRSLQPFDWYRDLVVAGGRFHRFPGDYLAALADVAAVPDPDARRGARHRELIARCDA